MPKAIQDAPELKTGLEFFYIAYLDLQSTRQSGLGAGEIPWTAIDAYAYRYGIIGEQYEELQYFIREMDDAYLEHKEEERKRKQPDKSKGR